MSSENEDNPLSFLPLPSTYTLDIMISRNNALMQRYCQIKQSCCFTGFLELRNNLMTFYDHRLNTLTIFVLMALGDKHHEI